MVCRVSPSFVRFGTFQLPALRGGDQLPLVRQLADYVIKHLYSHLEGTPLLMTLRCRLSSDLSGNRAGMF